MYCTIHYNIVIIIHHHLHHQPCWNQYEKHLCYHFTNWLPFLFSVFCGLLLTGCIVYRSIKNDLGGHIQRHDNPVKWHPTSLRQFLTCVSISELTFSCHFNILPMHTELRNQTRKNKRVILFLAMGITYVMNFTVSFFGYFQVCILL